MMIGAVSSIPPLPLLTMTIVNKDQLANKCWVMPSLQSKVTVIITM